MNKRVVWIAWTAGSLLLTLTIALKLQSRDRRAFLPGSTTSGHYQIESSCESCHTPFGGVRQESCLKCHEPDLKLAMDSHPQSKFTDPRNADRVANLDARLCITCHVEHRPEITSVMGVTLPVDNCAHCHSDIAKDRPSHKDFAFNTCASAGCHNFHDNQALYADLLVKHRDDPDSLPVPLVIPRTGANAAAAPRIALQNDAPPAAAKNPEILQQWSATTHARAGVNCSGCHNVEDPSGTKKWTDSPGYQVCQSCHAGETGGFLAGKHGMRLAANLSPMSPALARLPTTAESRNRELGCASCHKSHEFDIRRAAVDACLECHADKHSLAYKASPHFALWRAETNGNGAVGSGVSCATCHLPREMHDESEDGVVRVQHNQNFNLRPNEKMIRSVCLNCHGLGLSIDALADPVLIERNFNGRPSRHIESIDMAVRKTAK